MRALVHGSEYFRALAERAGGRPATATWCSFSGWRGDADERLGRRPGRPSPRPSRARRGAARWSAGCCGARTSTCSATPQREPPARRGGRRRAGGEVLLDQRIRPFGCHHQKFVVVRHAQHPADDVAYVGGIDLAPVAGTTIDHRGDPQSTASEPPVRADARRGTTSTCELRGPVVRDVEDVFRERWDDPAPLSRLPGTSSRPAPRPAPAGSPLPDPAPDPPEAGPARSRSCAPTRSAGPRTRSPRSGERSIARAYAKALRPRAAAGLRRGPVPVVRRRRAACSPPRCAGPRGCT